MLVHSTAAANPGNRPFPAGSGNRTRPAFRNDLSAGMGASAAWSHKARCEPAASSQLCTVVLAGAALLVAE
jgi:hypothetical protein